MNPRLYVVSMFQDQQRAGRRQLWLEPGVLAQAIADGAVAGDGAVPTASQREIILSVANIFHTNPDRIAWRMLRFTLLPVFTDGHFLG